jgi:hypothetical protein
MYYVTFDYILQGDEATEDNAREVAMSDFLGQFDISEQEIGYAQHVDTICGVGIYYDYAADYYFFTDETHNPNSQ